MKWQLSVTQLYPATIRHWSHRFRMYYTNRLYIWANMNKRMHFACTEYLVDTFFFIKNTVNRCCHNCAFFFFNSTCTKKVFISCYMCSAPVWRCSINDHWVFMLTAKNYAFSHVWTDVMCKNSETTICPTTQQPPESRAHITYQVDMFFCALRLSHTIFVPPHRTVAFIYLSSVYARCTQMCDTNSFMSGRVVVVVGIYPPPTMHTCLTGVVLYVCEDNFPHESCDAMEIIIAHIRANDASVEDCLYALYFVVVSPVIYNTHTLFIWKRVLYFLWVSLDAYVLHRGYYMCTSLTHELVEAFTECLLSV